MDGKYTAGTHVWFITRYDINSGIASDPREGTYKERVEGWVDPRCKIEVTEGDTTETVTVPEWRVFDSVAGLVTFLTEVMEKNVRACWNMYNRYSASRYKAERSKDVLEQYRSKLGTGESVQNVCDRILRRDVDDPLGLGGCADIVEAMERAYNNQCMTYVPYSASDTLWDLPPLQDGYVNIAGNLNKYKNKYFISYVYSKLQPEQEVPVVVEDICVKDSIVDDAVLTSWASAKESEPWRYAEDTDVFIVATLVKSSSPIYFVRDASGGFFSLPVSNDAGISFACRLDLTGALARAARQLIFFESSYSVTEEMYYAWANEKMTEDDIKIHYLPFTSYSFYHPTWVESAVQEWVSNNEVSDDVKQHFTSQPQESE